MSLEESWPRLRVGEQVRLRRDGQVVEVITVRRARDVLRELTEMQAILMGPKNQALYGVNWLDIYYEAQVRLPGGGGTIMVTPTDVEVGVRRS